MMSKLKHAFQAFNDALKSEPEDDNSGTEQAFGEAILADGSIVRWEGELAEGVAIMRVTDEGEVSLEDGSFVFEDGTTIEVRGGLVAAVAAIDEMADTAAFDADQFKAEILEMVEAKLKDFSENFEAKTDKIAEQFQTMTDSVLEAFSKLEEPKPLKPKATEPNDKVAKAIEMARHLKKFNT